jgi:MFS family permease
MMWLGTVPLTTGLVAQIFGTQFMATLVGFTFISHQVGSFLGTWLAGVMYDIYGNYDLIFWAAIVVGVLASFVHYPINDKPVARMAAARA